MAASQSETPKKQPTPKWVRGENTLSVYANNSNVQLSVYDVQLNFGRGRPATGGGVEVDEVATIMMSPQHAKALTRGLARAITEYEARFGSISIPDTTLEFEVQESTSAT